MKWLRSRLWRTVYGAAPRGITISAAQLGSQNGPNGLREQIELEQTLVLVRHSSEIYCNMRVIPLDIIATEVEAADFLVDRNRNEKAVGLFEHDGEHVAFELGLRPSARTRSSNERARWQSPRDTHGQAGLSLDQCGLR